MDGETSKGKPTQDHNDQQMGERNGRKGGKDIRQGRHGENSKIHSVGKISHVEPVYSRNSFPKAP